MHPFEYRKHARVVRERLEALHDSLSAAIRDLGALEAALEDLEARGVPELEKVVDDVNGMRNEQRQKIEDARQRGQGSGLYHALDQAKDLDRQQCELLDEARRRPEPDAREALRRYNDLERRQMAVLTDELGKFAAQGLEPLLDRYRELSEEQQKILTRIVGASGPPAVTR